MNDKSAHLFFVGRRTSYLNFIMSVVNMSLITVQCKDELYRSADQLICFLRLIFFTRLLFFSSRLHVSSTHGTGPIGIRTKVGG